MKPLIIGHRGAAGLAPENTLAAFARACELGVDGIELDVLVSADGELVVHHDFRLKPEIARTADGNWISSASPPAVKDLTVAQLKTYDVGPSAAENLLCRPLSGANPGGRRADPHLQGGH